MKSRKYNKENKVSNYNHLFNDIITKVSIISFIVTFLLYSSPLYGENEYPKSLCKLLSLYQEKMVQVNKTTDKYKKIAKSKLLRSLKQEQIKLTKSANLDGALEVRELVRKIKKNDYSSIMEITPKNSSKYVTNAINLFNKHDKKISTHKQKRKDKIIKELLFELNKKAKRYKSSKMVENSITTQQLIENIKSEDFSLINHKFITKKKKVEEEVKKVEKKESRISLKKDIVSITLKLGNNILTDDITSEKGRLLIYFSETLDPTNKTIKSLRKKIENHGYIAVLPCSFDKKGLKDILNKEILSLLNAKDFNSLIPKYCALLKFLDKDYKFDKIITKYIRRKHLNLKTLLNIHHDPFGGSVDAGDIRMQLNPRDSGNIKNSIIKAKQLQVKYPKNENISKLINELSKIERNIVTAKKITPKKEEIIFIDCDRCNKTGWIETKCDLCNGKNNQICQECIGSGKSYTKAECPDCNGSGKSWLGLTCKSCKGSGSITTKKTCPFCSGTGKNICKKCHGTNSIRKKCPICYGKGKIKQ